MNILQLLKKHQFCDDHLACPECHIIKYHGDNDVITGEHNEGCAWKEAIDSLESGRLLVKEAEPNKKCEHIWAARSFVNDPPVPCSDGGREYPGGMVVDSFYCPKCLEIKELGPVEKFQWTRLL